MGDHDVTVDNFFQEDNGNIETEAVGVDSSYFNQICININTMTGSNINFGNNQIGSSANTSIQSTLASTPKIYPLPGTRSNQKKRKKRNHDKPQNATVKVTFPGMIKKKYGRI